MVLEPGLGLGLRLGVGLGPAWLPADGLERATPLLNFIAVADHSVPSNPCDTLMLEREPRARAGAKREGSQLAALMPCLCRPERCEAKVCEVSESHTAKEPSDIPTTS